MAQVLVRGLDTTAVERLRSRAQRNGRSLEAELRWILQAAATDFEGARALAARLRRRLHGRRHTDSATLVAEARLR